MDTAYAMPDPKTPVTIQDIDPARTHEPDPPAVGVISPTCGSAVYVPGLPNPPAAPKPDAWSIEFGGTFNTKAKAVDAARKLMRNHAAVLGGGMMTTIERGRKFRPIILNMDERQATSACKRLRQAKAYCVVVTPKNLRATIAKTSVKQRKSR
jgi:D-alanyl-D-alanine carboxypeptidase